MEQKQIVYESNTVDFGTGEVMQQTTVARVSQEPEFVKLYLDCLSTFKGFSKTLNPILLEFLRNMSYATSDNGGQIIYINASMKKNIAKKLNKSTDRVNQALTEFVKNGIFKRVDTGMYQVNPFLFGRGHWKDIYKLRATFDFNTGTIVTNAEFQEQDENDNPNKESA